MKVCKSTAVVLTLLFHRTKAAQVVPQSRIVLFLHQYELVLFVLFEVWNYIIFFHCYLQFSANKHYRLYFNLEIGRNLGSSLENETKMFILFQNKPINTKIKEQNDIFAVVSYFFPELYISVSHPGVRGPIILGFISV